MGGPNSCGQLAAMIAAGFGRQTSRIAADSSLAGKPNGQTVCSGELVGTGNSAVSSCLVQVDLG